VDDTQKFSGAVKGVEQMVVVDTGKRVNGIEPVANESRNGSLGCRHFHGCRLCLLFAGRLCHDHSYSIERAIPTATSKERGKAAHPSLCKRRGTAACGQAAVRCYVESRSRGERGGVAIGFEQAVP